VALRIVARNDLQTIFQPEGLFGKGENFGRETPFVEIRFVDANHIRTKFIHKSLEFVFCL